MTSSVYTVRVADEKLAPGCNELRVCAALINFHIEILTPRCIQWQVPPEMGKS